MRPPAYAKAILAQRVEGKHPASIAVHFGPRWPMPQDGMAMVCVAQDWVPWSIDWRVAAGVEVDLYDTHEHMAQHPIIDGLPAWYWLAAEIQAVALDVRLWRAGHGACLAAIVAEHRQRSGQWPPYWPGELSAVAVDRWERSGLWRAMAA